MEWAYGKESAQRGDHQPQEPCLNDECYKLHSSTLCENFEENLNAFEIRVHNKSIASEPDSDLFPNSILRIEDGSISVCGLR